jgi:hypothetical protein
MEILVILIFQVLREKGVVAKSRHLDGSFFIVRENNALGRQMAMENVFAVQEFQGRENLIGNFFGSKL